MSTSNRPKRRRLAGAIALLAAMPAALAALALSGAPAEAATNACSNPVLASNLNGWGSLEGKWVTRDSVGDLAGASWAFDTGGKSFYMPSVSVTAGQKWTFSARDRVVYGSGTAKITVEWYNAAGTYLSEFSGPATTLPAANPSGGSPWYAVTATGTAPSGATSAHVLQFGDFGSATGTNFKATMCDYQLVATTTPTPTPAATQTTPPSSSTEAAKRLGWGTQNASQSDEYNGTSVDLTKWGLFGAEAGQTTGCSEGFNGHGQRCASQTKVSGGYLSVTGTADGKTGGLYSVGKAFRYGRVEVRERALPTGSTGNAWHAVPLMWPDDDDYTHGEIDFAERDIASPSVELFVHHDGDQDSCSRTINSTEFHNYAIDWQPSSVTWYVDGAQVCKVNASVPTWNTSNGGAQMDMFPTSGPMRPARQDVDWIRMYPNQYTQYR